VRQPVTQNLLADQTSPYLLQHKDNPVHWRPWGTAALDEARARNVPILLSIGYAACHWCHVMAHESFEDPVTAALMNELFVNIKVDREERPDIDAIYQNAIAVSGEQGGWPLTMFLAPNGEPFWGGTYFPPNSRYGRPGLRDLCREMARLCAQEPDKIVAARARLMDGLGRIAKGAEPGTAGLSLSMEQVDAIARLATRDSDPFCGGLGMAPKFPQPFVYEMILRAYLRTGQTAFRDALTLTLTRMAQGGIYDHLGGGFSRYSVDDEWLVPHFEKMLYDNAQLIDLYALAYAAFGTDLYRRRVEETIEFMVRDLRTASGGFAASLDADSDGHEGRYYVWAKGEVSVVLTSVAERFIQVYGVTQEGNWEGTNILNRLGFMDDLSDQEEADLSIARKLLLRARTRRTPPGFDDKILADWNGLVIHALARAAMIFHRPDWLDLARQAFAAITTSMSSCGRLYHSSRNHHMGAMGMADDYANMARAALTLHQATNDPAYLTQAIDWAEVLHAYFDAGEMGGYYMVATDAEDLIVRTRTAYDNATPAANGTMVIVLAHLYHLTNQDYFEGRALKLINAFAGELTKGRYGLASLLNGFDLLSDPVHAFVIGPPDDPHYQPMLDMIFATGLPNLILDRRLHTDDLPRQHPAFAKIAIGGRTTAYICRNRTCSIGLTNLDALAQALFNLKPKTA